MHLQSTAGSLKKLSAICLFTAACMMMLTAFTAQADQISETQVRSLFPKVDTLEGGAEMWLNTGVRTKQGKNHTVYSTTYSYYSGKSQKLMDIVRKGHYETNVSLYSFNNFVDASMYYRKLTKDAPKNRSQQVRFGERGLFFLYPKSGYINDADFYLVFINKTFVVWIHSSDGFALMDIANPINEALNKFILNNTKMYMIKQLTLEAYADGYKMQTKKIKFTTEFPASIKVSGRVFSKDIDPLPVATVNILETGDSFYTDSKGYFEHTILLDGIKDIELSTNFYLDYDKATEMTRFKGGMLNAALKYNKDGKTRNQLWKLETAGDRIFGTAYVKTSKGYRGYPVKGEMDSGKVKMTLDCSSAGSDFGCGQNFSGTLKGSGISGTWEGTGGGGIFSSDADKFKTVQRRIVLSGETAEMKTVHVGSGGMLLDSDSSVLDIGAGKNSESMIYVKPDIKALNLNLMTLASAKLVLTHLPDNQSGSMSVFKYTLRHQGKNTLLDNSSYAAQLNKSEEPYKVVIDITDLITDYGGAFLLGSVPEAGSAGNHRFAPVSAGYEALKPYIEITEYSKTAKKVQTEKPFVFMNKPVKSKDLLGDRNRPGPDGRPDYCYTAVFAYPGQKLTGFQMDITGDIRRRYNTNPLDIYPLVGFIKDGKLMNNSKGEIDIPLEKNAEKMKICINGSYVPKGNERISYRYFIDNKPVEGFIQ